MIKVRKISKAFDEIEAVKDTTLDIQDASVFGLLGTNGAGKSTLLRMMAGVLKPDEGNITIDGDPVWDNPESKSRLFYISDDQFYFVNGTAISQADFYRKFYPAFDMNRYRDLLKAFDLDAERKIGTYSKGMKKQLSILLAVSCNVPYILCDETFDGLDPVMRQGIKGLFAREMDERGLTPVIASHNLRELEDICDHIGLLHKGGVLLSKDLEDLKCNISKVQCVLDPSWDEKLKDRLDCLQYDRRGRLVTMTVRGKTDEILAQVEDCGPLFCEALPLSLEEIFISETEVVGYDIKSIIS